MKKPVIDTEPCPFCGSHDTEVTVVYKMAVRCKECGATGPQSWIVSECVDKWNKVSNEVNHGCKGS